VSGTAEADALGAEWLRVARSTQRCDRPAAEDAVRRLYREAGLAAPVPVWVDSPLAGLLAGTVLQHHPGYLLDPPAGPRGRFARHLLDQLPDPGVAHRVGGQVTDLVAGRLRGSPDRHGDEHRRRVGDELAARLEPLSWLVEQEAMARTTRMVHCSPRLLRGLPGGAGEALLGSPLLGSRLRMVEERLTWRVADRVRHHVDPSRAAAPLAMHPPAPGRSDPLADAVRELGWWWPLRGVAVLADRPTALHLDRDERPHRDGGPAIVHADGFAVHAWHGTRVPAELVTGAGWPVERVLAEPNADLRRCAIERTGWDRFVTGARLRQVGPDRPDPGNPGQVLRLYELPGELGRPDGRPARLLLVTNASADRDGSRRTYGLPVPAEVSDPVAAAALTFGLSPAEYAGLDRAT
jgi:uncharacterized protein DUF6745